MHQHSNIVTFLKDSRLVCSAEEACKAEFKVRFWSYIEVLRHPIPSGDSSPDKPTESYPNHRRWPQPPQLTSLICEQLPTVVTSRRLASHSPELRLWRMQFAPEADILEVGHRLLFEQIGQCSQRYRAGCRRYCENGLGRLRR